MAKYNRRNPGQTRAGGFDVAFSFNFNHVIIKFRVSTRQVVADKPEEFSDPQLFNFELLNRISDSFQVQHQTE